MIGHFNLEAREVGFHIGENAVGRDGTGGLRVSKDTSCSR